MSDDQQPVETITRQIPLDQLVAPEHDVRRERRDEQVSRIAQSLERSGQIHAAYVVPQRPDDYDADEWADLDDPQTMYEAADVYRIVDGWTRRLAAEEVNWQTLRCEVFPEEPDQQTVTSLEANTARIDMDEHETIVALKEMAARRGMTSEEVGELVGYSDSYIRNLFRLLDEPDQITDAWASPETEISAAHIAAISQLPDTQEKERMMRYVLEHDASVSQTRDYVESRLKTLEREAQQGSPRTADRATGMSQADPQQSADGEDEEGGVTCVLTGDRAYADIQIPVSEPMYGTLQRLQQTGDCLLDALEGDAESPEESPAETEAEAGW